MVLIGSEPIGVLDRLTNGRLHFEYDATYAQHDDATPLSISMPLSETSHGQATVLPWLAGLLPDNPDVLRRWAGLFGASSTDPFSLLATPIGGDCAGGVQFVRRERLDELINDPGRIEWLSVSDVETRLQTLRVDGAAWLGDRAGGSGSFVGQFSLAGRQRKTALLLDGERWGVPHGRIPTTHILKPPIEGFRDQELVEHLCLDAAARAGLITAESRVLAFGAESAIVVTRYDRRRTDDGLIRVHQEDLCQALSVPPDRKYEAEGGPGPRDIVRTLRATVPVDRAESDVGRFLDALAWNWIIAGTDAHAKNYSVLLSGKQVRLAPLYDVTSGLPYENEEHLRLAMKIGDDYELIGYQNPWPRIARRVGVDADKLTSRAAELCGLAPQAFAEAAAAPAVSALGRATPERLVDLVARRAARCARLL